MSSLKNYANLVALPHSVFALPYALVAFLLAHQKGALVESSLALNCQLLLMVFAVVCARTAAMAVNRIVDRDVDAKNPRTKNREIVSGKAVSYTHLTLPTSG